MKAVGMVIFFVAWACMAVSVIAMILFKWEARSIIRNEGGPIPWGLRNFNIPIDVGGLKGAAVDPATKANQATILACIFLVLGAGGWTLASPPPPWFLAVIAVMLICPITIAIYTHRISRH
jgi:hypothetical protein